MTEEERQRMRSNQGSLLNPTILGRPLFPSTDRIMQGAQRLADSLTPSFPEGGTPASPQSAGMAMSGVRSFGQPPPLIGTFGGGGRQTSAATEVVPNFPSGIGQGIATNAPIPVSSFPSTATATQPQPAAPTLTPPAQPTSGMGIMGNQNVGPLPTEQISPMARFEPTLSDRGNVSTDIVGMQGKTPIQTPYGTVYATAQQMGSERVSEIGQLPAQSARLENIGAQARQSAAVRQMRERGSELGRQIINRNENVFSAKRSERDMMRELPRKVSSQYYQSQPSTLADIQRDFSNYQAVGPKNMSNFVKSLYPEPNSSFNEGSFNDGGFAGIGRYGSGITQRTQYSKRPRNSSRQKDKSSTREESKASKSFDPLNSIAIGISPSLGIPDIFSGFPYI